MDIKKPSAREITAANQNKKEKEYWLTKLSGQLTKSDIPFVHMDKTGEPPDWPEKMQSAAFSLTGELFTGLKTLSSGIDQKLHIILAAGLAALLDRYSDSAGERDILIGTPIYKQAMDGEFINTAVPLRIRLKGDITFKQAIMQTMQTVKEAFEHQDYPLSVLAGQAAPKEEDGDSDEFPLFSCVILLENLQPRSYISHIEPYLDAIFSFSRTDSAVEMTIDYRADKYDSRFIHKTADHFQRLLSGSLSALDTPLTRVRMLGDAERRRLLEGFNRTGAEYPLDFTIQHFVEEQARRTPDNRAVEGKESALTYRRLNERANRLARLLRRNGVGKETVAGIMMEPEAGMVTALLAILKAGAAYLPIEVDLPRGRVLYMLENAGARVLLTTGRAVENISYTALQGLETPGKSEPILTAPRPPIAAFDSLPMPDRSLINLNKYKNKIGMASVADCISLQATRGCPYECLFCHKVWSKKHTFRSAEHIFNEIDFYYKQGVRNFAIIDDCFNLNRENSSRFFQLIVKNKLDIQLFFPNGLRGDLLTPGYIDLMAEAGTRGINLSLETASPRLQKLLKKHLDIDKFKQVMDYIADRHPRIILEIATMHGFPTETEEEAMMTLDFIKDIRWLHFPYIHILKVYPNTEMEALALEHGVSKEDILASRDLAFHELPETLPFPKSFTRQYQSDFMNNYFLSKERLKQVIPVQWTTMGEAAMAKKYDTYLPVDIDNLQDIIDFTGLDRAGLDLGADGPNAASAVPNIFDRDPGPPEAPPASAARILFLDLSQHFSSRSMLYNVVEQPIGQIALLTYLNQRLGAKISGRIYKAGNDFDSFEELKALVDDYRPDLVGIRALTFYKEFFHETAALLRQWGVTAPIIAGGPYATSDYPNILKDGNIDLAVLGEGEYTLAELVEHMLEQENGFKIPGPGVLKNIAGIAYRAQDTPQAADASRIVILLDRLAGALDKEDPADPAPAVNAGNLAYVMYTSGSTGAPKGVMVEHRQVQNCIWWMQEKFNLDETGAIVQRTNLSFDPSVWEIFWPLYVGGRVRILDNFQRKDAVYLVQLMAEPGDLTMMYCPATLVSAMTYVLNTRETPPALTLPWLIIGAEPISVETVKNFYTYYKGKIVNTYGPTECAINNTYYDIEPDDPRPVVPIGRPIANNRIYIMSKNGYLLPPEVAGEICIAGDSVVRGYTGDEEKTAEFFIDNPFGPGKLYKTGDIGRWLDDGVIEIMGRVDEQVKIRGHRIETGEIETALAAHSGIHRCLVTARDSKNQDREAQTCKKCGINTDYPGVRINADGNCDICENFSRYKSFFDMYFRNLEDLGQHIRSINTERGQKSKYDCLLLYAGGRGAGYALYQLADMGLNVLTATYDNGYFSKKDLENIKKITGSLGFDHVVLTNKNSDLILKESIRTAHTVCRGCFHASSSLAVEYAHNHDINVVVGATLSRGQIIENKLFMFAHQDISDVHLLEREITRVQRSAPDIDKKIFSYIGIDIINDRTAYEKVVTLDFFRYCDVSNRDMIAFLNDRDPYWKTRKNYAIYSTNCSIKQIGDYGHLQGAGFHYYGGATSWEKRLGHITLENLHEDLQCNVTHQGYERFLERVGILPKELAQRDEKYLVAYIVPDGDFEVDAASLREYLSDKLPHYMIPSYFVPLTEIPLTINGKVDRRKLPAPDLRQVSSAGYVKPGSKMEETLAGVWYEVLGIPLDRIGVDDNFFELGGDSIKAIQITARLQARQLKLDISQLFLNPTIRKAAECIDSTSRSIPQEPVSGDVPLTPIQHWFFKKNAGNPNRHHFNQSMMLYGKNGFDEEIIKNVFTRLVEHHDALRMVFAVDEADGTVRQFNRDIDDRLFELEVVDLQDRPDDGLPQEIAEQAGNMQRTIDLTRGPLVKLGLFKTGPGRGDHLLIIIQHLVVDGVSWRVLLEDLAIGYARALEDSDIVFQAKTDSFQYWAEKLTEYSQSDKALAELEYWKSVEENARGLEPLPVDHNVPPAGRTLQDSAAVAIDLGEDDTGKLLKEANRAYNTEINDILLTALGLAVKQWAGIEKVLIRLEGHGREPIMEDVNVSRTVGWFTTQFPVLLDMTGDDGGLLATHIKAIKESLRKIPNRGIGYGILSFLAEGADFQAEPEIEFNYLGQFGQESRDSEEGFGMSSMPKGDERSPDMTADYAISINGVVNGGKLMLTFAYNTKEFEEERMRALAGEYRRALLRIVDHCVNKEDAEMTVSDFDAADLDDEEMDAIYDELELG
jgi:amino acid adenylation domain-containing protein/non-ribosomal peptide synthase protein (TIGR01720 family)